MTREDRAARAAFVLAAGLFLLSLPWPEPASPPCSAPVEARALADRSWQVRCDGQGPPLRGPARLLFGLRMDPNRASASSLEVLPGIGPARAAAIVAERERRPFRRVDELRRVHGIGPRTLARIAPWLEVHAGGPRPADLQENR